MIFTDSRCSKFPALVGIMLSVVTVSQAGTGLYMGPYFSEPEARNITVHQGSIAYLPCVVKQLGDKSVSWVRQRDANILTIDKYTFVRDGRFTVYLSEETNTWTLVIKSVQARDAGAYECQISTEPKMSHLVNLHVLVPQVEFLGEKEKYVRLGSTTKLKCRVQSGVQLPDYIFWYHKGERLLEFDDPRISISVSRQGAEENKDLMSLTSVLLIKDTRPSDKGNYSCLPSNLDSACAFLHVLNGEHPAAMQTGSGMTVLPTLTYHLIIATSLISLLLPFWLLEQKTLFQNDEGNIKSLSNKRVFTPKKGSIIKSCKSDSRSIKFLRVQRKLIKSVV